MPSQDSVHIYFVIMRRDKKKKTFLIDVIHYNFMYTWKIRVLNDRRKGRRILSLNFEEKKTQ